MDFSSLARSSKRFASAVQACSATAFDPSAPSWINEFPFAAGFWAIFGTAGEDLVLSATSAFTFAAGALGAAGLEGVTSVPATGASGNFVGSILPVPSIPSLPVKLLYPSDRKRVG